MNRVVVSLDGLERATRVLDAAVDIARGHGAKLVLLRSVGVPPELPADLRKTTEKTLFDVLRKNAAAYLETMAGRVPKDVV